MRIPRTATLAGATMPGWALGRPDEAWVTGDIGLDAGRIAAPGIGGERIALGGRMVLPCFVDMHTHLDKGHIWPRAANPDGTFEGALRTVAADRAARWTEADVHARADFALRCAWAHGTRAVRTHLDSIAPQDAISWPVFERLRDAWAGRIALQAACLVPIDAVAEAEPFARLADRVAAHGGVLGAVTYPVPDLHARLRAFFRAAADRGLAADFHVDETLDPASETLRAIAEVKRAERFDAPVVAGHCCALSAQAPDRAMDTLDRVAEAGIGVVSLPMCNLYLQDRGTGTPRRRGVTLVHEMRARGIEVAFASDNTRDPFYAYGDLDMLEVLREATRIAHLDHSRADWGRAVSDAPAALCGFARQGLRAGDPADLVILSARSPTEMLARPQADRVVVRDGAAIDATPPDYAELDPLMEAS